MDTLINYWAVLGAAVAMMLVGSLWYGPFFGKKWMKLLGTTHADMKERSKRTGVSAPVAMALMFVCTLVLSYILANVILLLGAATEGDALLIAFWAWLGLVVPVLASFVLFEQRPVKLFLINIGYYFVAFGAAAFILAHWL